MGEKRTRMRGEERREFILAHAKKVFAEHSYAEASTRELARASDVTEPMLYKHFGNKKGLFMAVLREYCDRFFSMLGERVQRQAEQNLLEELGHVLVDYRETIAADPDIQKVLFQGVSESRDPQIANNVRKHNERMYALIYQLLERAQKEDLIRSDIKLDVAAWGYLSVVFAMQYNIVLNFQGGLTDETLLELNRLWLHSLRP
ncbi:MAG TPA: TetR/AcrR family transcriptional regulator [Ktedonobacteraceae bacterium]|nr:TetR/AcrR family transcriptional regulator [Ktedonobacteraceae bacterium]